MALPYDFSGYVALNPPDNALPFYVVDVSDFPASFFTNARADGGNLRGSDQQNRPLGIHVTSSWTNGGSSGSGLVCVQKPIVVNEFTRIRIWVGPSDLTAVAADAAYGQDSVYPPSCRGFYDTASATDATSWGHDLTPVGSPSGTLGTGPLSAGAQVFDGINDYFTRGTSNKPNAAPITMLGSVYPTTLTAAMTLMSLSDVGNTNDYFILDLRGDLDPDIARLTGRRSTVVNTDGPGVTINTWNHLAAVIESGSWKVFVNGVAGTPLTTGLVSPINMDNMSIGALLRTSAIQFLAGRAAFVAFFAEALSDAQIAAWHVMVSDQSAFYGSPTWKSSGITPPTAINEFELIDTITDETTLGYAMGFPRVFENDLYRNNLPDLPSSRFSILFSTDHTQVGTGRLWRADCDDIEGPYTITQVYTASHQREMYAPAYDAANNRVIISCHDNTSNSATYNDQHSVLLSTTDLANFTQIDSDLFPYGNHNGYSGWLRNEARDEWGAPHALVGGEYCWWGFSYGGDDLEFDLAGFLSVSPSHLLGHEIACHGSSCFEYIDGQLFLFDWVTPRPRLGDFTNKLYHAAFPMYEKWGQVPKYTDGHYKLFSKGSDPADYDYAPIEPGHYYNVDGTGYLLLAARDNAGENRLLLYRETSTAAEWVPSLVPINQVGGFDNPGPEQTVFNWNLADGEEVPDSITINALTGTNSSGAIAGGYELKTGSGSAQQVTLQIDETFDPTAHEVVEFTVYDWKIKPVAANSEAAHIVLVDGWSTGRDGLLFATSNTLDGIGVYPIKANSYVDNHDSYSMGVFDPATNIAGYTRTYGVNLTLRLQDYATKLIILIDGQVVYYEDLIAYDLAWNAATFAGLTVISATPFDEMYMSFSRLKLSTFNEVSRDLSLSAGQGIVRKANANVDAGVETFITSHS